MRKNTIAIAVAAALTLGAGSVAQANDNGSGEYHGGFKIGPLGQRFGPVRGPVLRFGYAGWHRHRYWGDFAYAPRHRRHWY